MKPQTPDNEVATTKATMNTQEINKRIAIACGWLDIKEQADDCGTVGLWGVPARHAKAVGLGSAFDYPIPDYYGDLNAMHEAEIILTDDEFKFGYLKHLSEVTECEWSDDRKFIGATSAQRAEAFLRTIGQWEEAE